ncbi:hypothetical protein Ahy_B02g059966 [Arachis hypogaea]|uniref:Replication factor A C-terminal domain-containing protein n=1 Tax=Arachis hypogaea TaxID=3818 RepID=A0A445AHJ9_ARAHY|nr:hypothetical protein Ahy_B02g059966 [Arachis hypogaea]
MKTKMKIKKTKKIVTRLGYGSGLEGEGNGKSSSRGSQVEIVCLYEFPNKWNPREINSMELVLQDERGDRIHCSILKSNMVVFRTLICEHELYAMKNFIIQAVGQSVRTTSHKYKLSFYTKTLGSLLPSDTFLFNSFQFISYEKIEAMVDVNKNHLLATVVSIDVGGSDWYYASCKSCPRKLKENKGRYLCEHSGNVGFNSPLRYRLHVIAADGTGYIGLIIWNQEAKLVVGKSASEVKDLSGVEQSVSNLLPTSFTNAAKSDVHFAVVVSLSKVCSESIFECGLKTPGKGVVDDSNAGAAIGVVYNPNV